MLLPPDNGPDADSMPWKYGAGRGTDAQAAARERVGDILQLLAGRLAEQRARGSRFFFGDALSAADIYWATFSNLIDPLAPEKSPMPEWLRPIYAMDGPDDPEVDASLIEHRDFVFEEFIGLPQDF